jgi:hypothetical protein
VILRAEVTVGPVRMGRHVTAMAFRLLVKVDELAVSRRDQPSGTLSVKCPAAEVNGTYTVVSGMSPGGLLSAGTGASEDRLTAGFGAPAAAGRLVDVAGWLVLPEPPAPHPARITARLAPVVTPIHLAADVLVEVAIWLV